MTETSVSLPEAARQLGVKIRTLRGAIRAGAIPAPPHTGATAWLPAEWLARAKEAIDAPSAAVRAPRPKVPAFIRYEGTSAWRKYKHRVRAYEEFRAG